MKNLNAFISKWEGVQIDNDGGYTSNQYKEFQSEYKALLKSVICKETDTVLHSFNPSHYEFSAVLKHPETNTFYYISISDVRFWQDQWLNHILFRTMQHDKDWSGGHNQFSTLYELSENLTNLINYQNRYVSTYNDLER